MFAGPQLLLAALFATPPPIYEVGQVLDDVWAKSTSEFGACSAKADAAKRAGTVWIDLVFPKFEYPYSRKPRLTLRKSPGLLATDAMCVRAVVARKVLPGMTNISLYSRGDTLTKAIALGTNTRYLPPLPSFLPSWRKVARAPDAPSRRARLSREVGPLAMIDAAGCLVVRREERLQRARLDWLAGAGRTLPDLSVSLIDRLSRTEHVAEPQLFEIDGGLMLAGVRFDKRKSNQKPTDWSRRLETYCLLPSSAELEIVPERRRGKHDFQIGACCRGHG
jgi:hypothetical protein